MDERALKRRLFLGLLCFLLLTAYFILGAQYRNLHTALPAVVFSRTDHSQYWTGSLDLRGSLAFKLLAVDRSFSGTVSIPGYPETSQERFTGSIYLNSGANHGIYQGPLVYFREKTSDAFFLGKVLTTKRLDSFSLSLTAPGTMRPLDAEGSYALDYILIAPCTSLADAVAWAEAQGLLEP